MGDSTPEDSDPEQIERTDVGGSIQVTFQRGTGTDNRDTWRVKGKGDTAERAIAEFREELDAVREEFVTEVRNIQPVEGDDE